MLYHQYYESEDEADEKTPLRKILFEKAPSAPPHGTQPSKGAAKNPFYNLFEGLSKSPKSRTSDFASTSRSKGATKGPAKKGPAKK